MGPAHTATTTGRDVPSDGEEDFGLPRFLVHPVDDRRDVIDREPTVEPRGLGETRREDPAAVVDALVVADEIGKLADQTSASVKEIDKLIKKSENEINRGMENVRDTVEIISSILKGVNEINVMINEIGNSMEDNVSSTEIVNTEAVNIAALSEQIDIATKEQKKAADEIVQSITYMNELSQSNAASAEEISANAEDIAAMSKDVSNKISTLDLEKM